MHNPEHAVAPLPPPLHVVAVCIPGAKQRVHQTHPPLFPAPTLPGRARQCSQLAELEHRDRKRTAGGPAGQQSEGNAASSCSQPAKTNGALALNGHSAVLLPPGPTLSSARHLRHCPGHAVVPLPPPLHDVAKSFHGANSENKSWTNDCFRRSQPAGAPGSAQDMLAGCMGFPEGQQGGKRVLHSPASLPAFSEPPPISA